MREEQQKKVLLAKSPTFAFIDPQTCRLSAELLFA